MGRSPLQIIQRTGDLPAHRFGEVGVDLCRAHIRVSEELLHGPDVDPPQHQMGRKAMTEHMRSHSFGKTRQLCRTFQFPRDGDLVQVVPSASVG